MRATVARNTGWTYWQIGRHSASDILALLKDLEERPPSYLIDGAVHLAPKKPRISSEKEILEAAPYLGHQQPLPDHLRAMREAAEAKFRR